MNKMTVRDVAVRGKRVLVRVDFNVPMDEKSFKITDDSRIRASLPTIKYLIENGAKVILMSHLGRPKGKPTEQFRLAPVAQRLSEILGKPVIAAKDCIGQEVEKQAQSLQPGQVLLLENLRFYPDEEEGTASFAQALAKSGEIYVNDAFGTCHRPHASISGISKYLPAVAGFLLEKELLNLGNILENPAKPFAAILGGAKISDKVALLNNIMGKVDMLLIGGGMAATFFKAQGKEVGQSLVESESLGTAKELIDKAAKQKVKLVLPADVVVAREVKAESQIKTVPADSIPKDQRIVDIGAQTVKNFSSELKRCQTVFWNGPMGIYEIPRFARGTQELARTLAGLKAKTIIGGGSTGEAVYEMGLAEKMTFVSTGGGASLSFLGGEKLPGVEALMDKKA